MTDKAPDAMPGFTPYPGWQIIVDWQGAIHHLPTAEYITALKSELDEIIKRTCKGSSWEHAHEIISFYRGLSSLYERAFFAVIKDEDLTNHTVQTAMSRVHETNRVGLVEWAEDREKKYAALQKLADDMARVLQEAEEYFDERADADCDQDGYIPNEGMKLQIEARQCREAYEKFMKGEKDAQ